MDLFGRIFWVIVTDFSVSSRIFVQFFVFCSGYNDVFAQKKCNIAPLQEVILGLFYIFTID